MLPFKHSLIINHSSVSMSYPHPKNHIIVKQRLGTVGKPLVIPVLYFRTDEETKRVESLLDYFLDNSGRSDQWMKYRARALGYFYDYCTSLPFNSNVANHPLVHKRIIRGFLFALLNGTIDKDTGIDELGLYWPSTGINIVKRICRALTDIVEYCYNNELVTGNLFSGQSNPIPNSEPTALSFLHVAHKIKGQSFLSHIINVSALTRRLQSQRKNSPFYFDAPSPENSLAPKRFPDELIGPLFKYGFIKNKDAKKLEDREDIPAKMCCLLWLFTGMRKSEPLHLWINDVVYVQGHGLKVIQRHPSESHTYLIGEDMTRKEYLKRIGRMPRNQETTKSQKARWKNLSLGEGGQAYVYFLHKSAEELFMAMYNYYITHVRPEKMDVLENNGKPSHPFLFVSSGVDRSTGKSYVGEPYSAKALGDAFNNALDRVENELGIKIPRGRSNNTNPHAARHFYIGTLKDAGIDAKVIQKAVKHGSILSQNAYDAPTEERVQSVMDNVKLELSNKGITYDCK